MKWYETTPTVMSANGTVTYVNFPPDRLPQDKASQDWVKRAKDKGEFPVIYTRKAAVLAVEASKADPKTIDAATLDVAAPVLGTAEAKAEAVAVKEQTVLTVAEWLKVEAAVAKVAVVVDEKPIEEKPAVKG